MDIRNDRHTYGPNRKDSQTFGNTEHTYNNIGVQYDKNKIGILMGKVI